MRIILMSLFILIFSQNVFCEDDDYTSRPDINNLTPKKFIETDNSHQKVWSEKAKKGLLHFIAEQRALYPGTDRYYLARDGEFLYDLERALFKDEPEKLKKIHLLNISRKHVKGDKPLLAYLEQNGVTKPGKKIFIDTAFTGSILKRIKFAYPDKFKHVEQHLMMSGDPNIPQSHAFWSGMDVPEASRVDMMNYYEKIPHYTNTSYNYETINGKLVPVSKPIDKEARKKALKVMADIKYFASQSENQKDFNDIQTAMKNLISEVKNGSFVLRSTKLDKELEKRLILDIQDSWKAGNIDIDEGLMKKFLNIIPGDYLTLGSADEIVAFKLSNTSMRKKGTSKTKQCLLKAYYALKDLSD
jgi:hypothetical protein